MSDFLFFRNVLCNASQWAGLPRRKLLAMPVRILTVTPGEGDLLTSSGQRPRMPLNGYYTMHRTVPSPLTKNYLTPNSNSAELEKSQVAPGPFARALHPTLHFHKLLSSSLDSCFLFPISGGPSPKPDEC